MQIAILTPCYWPEVNRGAERVAHELATWLHGRGHRMRIITSHPGWPSRRDEDGVEVVRLWRPPDGMLTRRGFEEHLTHAPSSLAALFAGGDQIAHAQTAQEAVVAAIWGHRRGAPVVFSYTGLPTWDHLRNRRGRLRATLRACRESDRVVTPSRAAAEEFRSSIGVHADVIHPGVDPDRFSPGGERAAQPTIFCAAPLEVAYKRVELLVRAMQHVRRSRPGTHLVLLRPRDRDLAERALAECEGLGFVEPRPGGDDGVLLANYRSAWVTALPSHGETFGLGLVESLACGTPVVGTDTGGIPEIIDRPEVGRLFHGNELKLAAALLETLELSEQRGTAQACRSRALELSADATAAAYEALYRELLEEHTYARW